MPAVSPPGGVLMFPLLPVVKHLMSIQSMDGPVWFRHTVPALQGAQVKASTVAEGQRELPVSVQC